MSNSIQPKFISPRVSFVRTDERLTVIITQEVSRLKESLLFIWAAAWLAVLAVFVYFWMHSLPGSSDRIFFAISTAFGAYFLVKAIKVYLWRKIGRELLMIEGEELSLKMAYRNYGKPKHFNTNNIRKFGLIPYDITKFGQFAERSFWTIGGETLGFEHHKTKVAFGKQLENDEAKHIARIIEKALREIPARARRAL
jgi:hypothetical protein